MNEEELKQLAKQFKDNGDPRDKELINYLNNISLTADSYDSEIVYRHKDILIKKLYDYFINNELLSNIIAKSSLRDAYVYQLVRLNFNKLVDVIGINNEVIAQIKSTLNHDGLDISMPITERDISLLNKYIENKKHKKRLYY